MSPPKVEQVTTDYLILGEGPHWDDEKQVLYYVGIHDELLLKYDPASGRVTSAKLDGDIGFIVPVEGRKDQFIVALGRAFVVVEWDGDTDNAKVVETITKVEQDPKFEGNRINDGKADPNGRIFAGTIGKGHSLETTVRKKSSLYRLDKSKATPVEDSITISNGLAWNVPKKTMYYIDSVTYSVFAYDYDFSTGDMTNKRVVINFKKSGVEGLPDGMTIDTDGNLWIACFGGSQVVKVDPNNGKVLQSVKIPAQQITSVAFGGKNLDELYVTSAKMNFLGLPPDPPAGAVFKVTGLGVKGLPAQKCKLEK